MAVFRLHPSTRPFVVLFCPPSDTLNGPSLSRTPALAISKLHDELLRKIQVPSAVAGTSPVGGSGAGLAITTLSIPLLPFLVASVIFVPLGIAVVVNGEGDGDAELDEEAVDEGGGCCW